MSEIEGVVTEQLPSALYRVRLDAGRFVTAHIVGSSIYIGVFLGLGALFGPRVAEYLHLPALELRLIWLLALAIGLPIVLAWICYRGHASYNAAPSRRRTFGASSAASRTSRGASFATPGPRRPAPRRSLQARVAAPTAARL